MILVERDAPGLEIVRALPVFGYQDQEGHCELRFTDEPRKGFFSRMFGG